MVEPSGLTSEEVRATAELAKLDLSDTEVELYTPQLSAIFEHFQRLQELDTSHIEPTASVLPLKNVLRPDVAAEALSSDVVIANASQADEGQFWVSPVLDNE